jgi:hypothetical protein
LASTLAQLADFRGKLVNSINDTLSDYVAAFVAEFAFVPSLDRDHRENGEDDEQQQTHRPGRHAAG